MARLTRVALLLLACVAGGAGVAAVSAPTHAAQARAALPRPRVLTPRRVAPGRAPPAGGGL
jgi:hypothetical protein